MRRAGRACRGDNPRKKPSGTYARTLTMMSLRIGLAGRNRKNGVPGAGAIHGEKGCRLAYTMASAYSAARKCDSTERCACGVRINSMVGGGAAPLDCGAVGLSLMARRAACASP